MFKSFTLAGRDFDSTLIFNAKNIVNDLFVVPKSLST